MTAVTNWSPVGRVQLTQTGSGYVTSYTPYTPKLLGSVTFSHLTRNQLNLNFASSSNTTTIPQKYWYPSALTNDGGAYAFDGTTTEIAGTFIFDLSSLATAPIDQQLFYLNVTDSSSGNTLSINRFEILDPTTGNPLSSAAGLPLFLDLGSKSVIIGTYTADTLPPSTPILTGSSSVVRKGKNYVTSIKLSWSASTDSSGISKYRVYRNNIILTEVTTLSATDNTTSSGKTYTYQVSAIDTKGNESIKSNSFTYP